VVAGPLLFLLLGAAPGRRRRWRTHTRSVFEILCGVHK
jgi:hypothetical protein